MTELKFTEPAFSFAETTIVTGVSDAWLRTLIQRDKDGLIGTKHRVGRLLFSLADIAAISILHNLNAHLGVAPSVAWDVLKAAGNILRARADESDTSEGRQKDGADPQPLEGDIRIGFDSEGGALIWTMDDDGVLVTWNDNADENQFEALQARHKAHIVIPMVAIFGPVFEALKMAESWKDAE